VASVLLPRPRACPPSTCAPRFVCSWPRRASPGFSPGRDDRPRPNDTSYADRPRSITSRAVSDMRRNRPDAGLHVFRPEGPPPPHGLRCSLGAGTRSLLMSVEPRQSPGTRGIIYIECQYHANMPAEFLVSFGGAKDGAGAFYLGRATGFDPLTTLLGKLGLSSSVVHTALRGSGQRQSRCMFSA